MSFFTVLNAGSDERPVLTGYEIAEKAYHAEDGNDVKALMHMEIVKSNGKKKIRKLAMARKDFGKSNRSLIYFTEPADVKGTSFLTWNHADKEENDQWLYLPALKRVKRISTTNKSKSFMGSDFSYEDFSKRSLQKDTYRLIGEEKIDGSLCYLIESVSKDTSETILKRMIWVRSDTYLIIKTDLYGAGEKLLKRFTTGEVKSVQGIETIVFFKMEDLQKGGHSTMRLEKIRYNNGLEDRMFSVEGIKK